MEKKTACLAQAKLYRAKALADPLNRAHWLAKAKAWERVAADKVGRVAITHEIRDGQLVQKLPTRGRVRFTWWSRLSRSLRTAIFQISRNLTISGLLSIETQETDHSHQI